MIQQVKAKTITEIHSEAEKNLGLRPGATASIRNNRNIVSGAQGTTGPGGFPITRPGSGGMMPGMPGTRKMPGMPGSDNDNWEVPRARSMPRGDGSGVQTRVQQTHVQSPLMGKSMPLNSKLLPQGSAGFMSGRTSALLQGSGPPARTANFGLGTESALQSPMPAMPVPAASIVPAAEKPLAPVARMNPDDLRRKTASLLEEYFSVRILDEALQCVEELKTPAYHPEVVKEAISLALEKSPPQVEPVVKLLDYLLSKMVLTRADIEVGCIQYGSMLDDLGIDLPKAPNNFGEVIGKLVLAGGLDFKVVREILKKVEDDMFQKVVLDSAMKTVSSSPSGQGVLDSQAPEVAACRDML